MPALAEKIAPEYHDDYSVSTIESPASTRARRWQEEKPGSRKRSSHINRVTPDGEDVEELLSHFGHGSAARDSQTREQIEARREERRLARRRHRPFRMSLPAIVMVAAPLCLLASLLWTRSNALAMARRDAELQKNINAARFDMERTRQEIAAMNASPHLEAWAKERGWRRATQQDFDQVPSTVVANASERENEAAQ